MAMHLAQQPHGRRIERWTTGAGLAITGAILLGFIDGLDLYAAEKKEVYVSPGANKKTLLNEPVPGMDGREITIEHHSFPPGWVGGKHYHTGPVYVYILEGSFATDEQGKERQTLKAGELYREPIGTPMQARNPNPSEPLKILVFQVGPKGEPLMIKVD
jgi:quercetin dioxygenase-like cupin family protein